MSLPISSIKLFCVILLREHFTSIIDERFSIRMSYLIVENPVSFDTSNLASGKIGFISEYNIL